MFKRRLTAAALFESLEPRKLLSTVTVAPVTVNATSTSTSATFTASLNAPSAADVTITYSTSDGSAKAGKDFTQRSSSLTIPAGQTSGTFSVAINPTNISGSPKKTFNINLGVSPGNKLKSKKVKATIVDANPAATYFAAPLTIPEGQLGQISDAVVTIQLSSPSAKDTKISFDTVSASATAGSDFKPTSGKVTIKAGQTSAAVKIKIFGDNTVEGDETFDVTLSNKTSGLVTIVDDDGATASYPAVALQSQFITASTTVALTASLVVTLSAAPVFTATVDIATSDGSATAGTDYDATRSELTFAPGQTTQIFPVRIYASSASADRTINITLANPVNATLPVSTATLTISHEGGSTPTLPLLSVASASVIASATSTTTLSFTVTLSSASGSPVTVLYSTMDVSALAGTDYVAANGTLTFPAGTTTQTVNVTVNPSTATAGAKLLTLNLSAPANATFANNTANGIINFTGDTIPGTGGALADNLASTSGGAESAESGK